MIYFRSNHRNFSTLIRETSALYVACEAVVIINATEGVGEEKGVGEEEGAGDEVSSSSLRLIRCTFDR
jgi:hypothetical protein